MPHNTDIGAMSNIQLIDKQGKAYRLLIDGIECSFTRLDLYTTGLKPLKRCIANNRMGWYVNRKFISYWQVKKVIKIL